MSIFPIQRGAMCCIRCGQVCDRKSSKRLYCAECAKQRGRQKLREYKRRQRELATQARSATIISCDAGCGRLFVKRTSQHRMCSECRRQSDIESRRRISARHRNSSEAVRQDNARRQRERRARNPKFAIHARMSAAVYQALREQKAGRSWESIVGYSLAELVAHLERQFLSGMSWENYGEWHIDHIRPIASFSYISDADPAFRDCWALPNLRPLWALENMSKNDRRTLLI